MNQTLTRFAAMEFLRNAGAHVRLVGKCGLCDDRPPQIEARALACDDWSYVAQIAEDEVVANSVYYWVDQHILHTAAPTTRGRVL